MLDLPDGMMFLMRPVLNGMCKYESLKDGSLELADILWMNTAIRVDNENQYRIQKANMEE